MKKAKKYKIINKSFNLNQRLEKIENLLLLNESQIYLSSLERCKSSYSKSELAILFYILMDEGLLFFDPSDVKKNRISFQEFISANFTYRDNEGVQKKITRISRQFSECKGYTYKEKQIKFLDDLIGILMERKRKLENW
ncbi:hypothetical protein [Flavobacterium saccharophilum]|uniref:Uncharacterized protein n=1 Tax=Flavobacterium saccharophilum TaxID=29534 RepID=A0A1M7MEX0_9FLAO|nr:hypothetical protein [Flavobacterium saccharophilum]SHM88912.1 hypothetical protein SAMN05444366_4497 [Flavobacterium saccharophilum]